MPQPVPGGRRSVKSHPTPDGREWTFRQRAFVPSMLSCRTGHRSGVSGRIVSFMLDWTDCHASPSGIVAPDVRWALRSSHQRALLTRMFA